MNVFREKRQGLVKNVQSRVRLGVGTIVIPMFGHCEKRKEEATTRDESRKHFRETFGLSRPPEGDDRAPEGKRRISPSDL